MVRAVEKVESVRDKGGLRRLSSVSSVSSVSSLYIYIYIYIYIYMYIYMYIYIYIYILAEKRAAFLAGAHAAGIADQKGKQENLEIASASLPRKELEVEEEKVVVKAGRFGGGREKAATMGGHSKVVGKGECSLEAPPPDGARTPVRGECFGWCA